jgi:anti-sigma B factor antagonist
MLPRPAYPPLQVEKIENVTVVRVITEHLAEENVQAVGEELFTLVAGMANGRLTLDMGGVRYLTSTALGKLVALHARVKERGGQLVLVNVTDVVCEVFEVTCLHQVLDLRRGPALEEGRAP